MSVKLTVNCCLNSVNFKKYNSVKYTVTMVNIFAVDVFKSKNEKEKKTFKKCRDFCIDEFQSIREYFELVIQLGALTC